ncbi:MAG: response regulator transcription factor [Acidobacteriota bacterium]
MSGTSANGPEKGTIALVDDEENLRETVGYALRREGYRVDAYPDGQAAWEALERDPADVVVLDVMMPRMDGLELCRRLRAQSESLPIIFLTSRDEEFDRVLGLELGADDYLCKPFSMRELVARVKVLFRRLALDRRPRQGDDADKLIEVGHLTLDLQRYTAHWKQHPVQLTVTEFLILDALARHPGHVKSRQQLIQDGYPHDTYVSDRTIDSHIKRLRRKLADVDEGFDGIETVYGLGYRYRQP